MEVAKVSPKRVGKIDTDKGPGVKGPGTEMATSVFSSVDDNTEERNPDAPLTWYVNLERLKGKDRAVTSSRLMKRSRSCDS
eukprot:2883492-Rhodomonas_salina.1